MTLVNIWALIIFKNPNILPLKLHTHTHTHTHTHIYIYIVRTSFGLDPKTGLGFGPTSPNNKFVERGRKN